MKHDCAKIEEDSAWLRERVRVLREALRWYAEHSEAASRYLHAAPPKLEAITALVTTLALDAGKRAREALAQEPRAEGEEK